MSVPEDDHEKLREERRQHASFEDAIDRLLGRRQLEDCWGVWDTQTATHARRAIDTGRANSAERLERVRD